MDTCRSLSSDLIQRHIKLDEYEHDLHNDLQKGNFKLHTDKSTIQKYAEIFKLSNHERKALSLRMPRKDYFEIKAKALKILVPRKAVLSAEW